MSSYKHIKQLSQDIERLRNKMVETASNYGYTSQESIKISQELDTLLNEYQFHLSQKNKMT